TEGVQRLGGKDFDARLLGMVRERFREACGEEMRPGDCDFGRNDAEDLKHRLSARETVRVALRSARNGRVPVTVRRADLETATGGLIAQAEMACEGVLLRAAVDRASLAGVFLAGGACRMPSVREAVERVFGRRPLLRDPDTAVARGAALYAAHRADPALLSPAQRRRATEIRFQDIAPHYYGTLAVDEDGLLENSVIIAKGEKLPVSRTRTYYTAEPDQRVLTCEVTQSAVAESDPAMVLRVAEVEMPLPAGRPADQPVEVTFSYDLDGVMRAEFKDLGTGRPLVIELKSEGSGRGSLNVSRIRLE
ncbi:MAG: Hsp70 family protein, partial [Opitutales bacterium]